MNTEKRGKRENLMEPPAPPSLKVQCIKNEEGKKDNC
jgi:hypothetical protein